MATIHATQTMMQIAARPKSARAVDAVSNFLRAWKNRREFYRLGEMSDAELSDIGLTRSDLNVAVDLPFEQRPDRAFSAPSPTPQRDIENTARQSRASNLPLAGVSSRLARTPDAAQQRTRRISDPRSGSWG